LPACRQAGYTKLAMHTLRTRFGKDIIADFLPPTKKTKNKKVIIFCDGMPSVPSKKTVLEFWSKKGYWVIHPRYRGTWESSGSFLQFSLEQDVLQIVNLLPKGFKSLWDGKTYKIKNAQIFLFGNSFGGPAAILASQDERVKKVVLMSPVTDWVAVHKVNSRDAKLTFIKKAYGEAYRINQNNWNKLKTGKFYNPISATEKIDGAKLLIFQAKNDQSVPWNSVKKFAEKTRAKIYLAKTGGHYGSRDYIRPSFLKKINTFIK
jgi:alpha-beta hydrolase superfamily lysophospholipase